MRHEIRKSGAAETDLIEIWVYSRDNWGEEAADSYLDGIAAALERVSRHPEIGTDCAHLRRGYRRLTAGRHRLYYRIGDGFIDVIRVLHASMDPAEHLDP